MCFSQMAGTMQAMWQAAGGQGAAFMAYWKKLADERGIDVHATATKRGTFEPAPEPTNEPDPLMAARNRAVRAR